MDAYHQQALAELRDWQKEMLGRPSFFNKVAKRMQDKVNSWIPEKVHKAVTTAIKQMIRAVLFGAGYTTGERNEDLGFEAREQLVEEKIRFYQTTAAVEGGVTGAGGFLMGLVDFPVLLALKIKLLFEIAAIYKMDVDDYKERVYLLHIFELSFSSHSHRRAVYLKMIDWEEKSRALPADIHQFDWRHFQQEYRDYIDLAKMAQLLPVIGAPVGVLVNYRLVKKLGHTAMNAYRMRVLRGNELQR